MNPELGWHFVGNRLRCGSPVPKDGVLLRYNDDVVFGESGLYAGKTVLDAACKSWADNLILCRVELHDVVDQTDYVMAGRGRKILWRMDASKVFMEAAKRVNRRFFDLYKGQGAPIMKVIMIQDTGSERLISREKGEELLQELIKKYR